MLSNRSSLCGVTVWAVVLMMTATVECYGNPYDSYTRPAPYRPAPYRPEPVRYRTEPDSYRSAPYRSDSYSSEQVRYRPAPYRREPYRPEPAPYRPASYRPDPYRRPPSPEPPAATTPEPPAPSAPPTTTPEPTTPPAPLATTTQPESSSEESMSREDDYRVRPHHRECSCPKHTAGLILLDVQNPASNYAVDGTILTANTTAPNATCANCGAAHLSHSKRIVRQKFCYSESGSITGVEGLNDVWLLCSNTTNPKQSLCVCVVDDDDDDRSEHGRRRRCFKIQKPSGFVGVGGQALARCQNGECRMYWVNFKGQEIISTHRPSIVLKGDNNTNEELTPDNEYYLSGRTLAVSCSGCEAINEGRVECAGKRQPPTPVPPSAPTLPVCRPRRESSSEEGRRDRGARVCQRCGQCSAGLELYRFEDPEFAIDGAELSFDVHPPVSNNTCRGCRSERRRDNDPEIIIGRERENSLKEHCYADGGAKNGADYFGSSFYLVCDKPQDLCVCALSRDGRLEDDVVKHKHKRACYGVTQNATWGGAIADIVTKCRPWGDCHNFFVPADNLTVSNGARTFAGDNNTVPFSFENNHYLHAPRLAVGCRGCRELEERLRCRERNSRGSSSSSSSSSSSEE